MYMRLSSRDKKSRALAPQFWCKDQFSKREFAKFSARFERVRPSKDIRRTMATATRKPVGFAGSGADSHLTRE